jgi:tetratricopeptide (TPR) repeat protein
MVAMNASLRMCVLLSAMSLLPVYAAAQVVALPSTNGGGITLYSTCILTGRVATLQGNPVAGAKVQVTPRSFSAPSRILFTDHQGGFQVAYSLNVGEVKEYAAEVNVTKRGFRKASLFLFLDYEQVGLTLSIHVTLRETGENPELLSQADLISGLAPRLKKLRSSDGLSSAGEKDYARGVAEFLEANGPDRALPFFTKVTRRDASCLPCRTMLALAELASGDWDGAYHNLAEASNKILADRSLGRPEPLVALGVMESWRQQPKIAAGYFAEAIKYAPQDPLALQELGRSQLLIENWGAADEYLGKAIAAGAGPAVRLLRVQALLARGQSQAAGSEMTSYLNGRDVKQMPLHVRELWAQIEQRNKIEAVYGKGKTKGDQPLDYLHRLPPDLTGLEPATDQAQLDSILSGVGKTVAEFFSNFPNTSSLEQVHQEKLSRKEKVAGEFDQKFRYLCFTPPQAWGLGFDEYRVDPSGGEAWLRGREDGFMLTSGFASASLIFHPAYQPQADFRYLGRQKVNGREDYLIAFAQQPAKARVNGAFKSGQTTMTTFSQGLAWIDPQSYQITRLRTDLLRPLPEINLQRETTEIVYGEVHFKDMNAGFWVPQQVIVSVDWNGKHLRNEHRYSEFKLFRVEANEKIGTRREPGQTPKPTTDPPAAP